MVSTLPCQRARLSPRWRSRCRPGATRNRTGGSVNITDFIARLDAHGSKPHRNGSGWKALCPAHKDREPSITITEGKAGRTLIKCFAGCSAPSIVGALGLAMSDLFVSKSTSKGRIVAPPTRPITCQPKPARSFDWLACVAAFIEAHASELAEWRGYSPQFVAWLHGEKLVGIYKDEQSGEQIAFPVHDATGAVVSCHSRTIGGSRKWLYHPAGNGTHPLIIGD